jgi:MFS family permease
MHPSIARSPSPVPASLWRHRDFLLFWLGETVSLLGSQVTLLALPLTAVLVLHASVLQLGLLNAASFLPFLLVTLPAGAWLDRHRRRPVLLAANIGRAAVIALVPVAAVLGILRIEVLVAVAFTHGILTVFYDVGWLSYIPSIVSRDLIIGANSRLQVSASAAQVGGPGIGGILVQVLSAPIALVVDAISFGFSAMMLVLIRAAEPQQGSTATTSMRRDIAEGLQVTFRNRVLRAMALNAATFNLFDQIVVTVFLLFAVGPLGLTPAVIGVVLAAGSVGGFVGALVAGPAARRLGLGPAMIASSFVGGSTIVAIPFVGGSTPVVSTLLAAIFFIRGLGEGVANVHFVSLRQAVTAPELLGRMNASYRTLTYGAIPVGAIVGGALGQILGLHTTLLIAGIGLLLTPVILLLGPLPSIRDLPAE